ncbi:methylase [Dialister sp. CAG:588]|nr:methylase [Dialister sp. CAG:588]
MYEDAWKEEFSLQIESSHTTMGTVSDKYKIIGFPFFNKENRMEEFELAIDSWLEKM